MNFNLDPGKFREHKGLHPRSAKQFSINDRVELQAEQIPSYRVKRARARGTTTQWLLRTWGGLGDTVCALPTVDFILKRMPHISLSVVTDWPEVFHGKPGLNVFANGDKIDFDKYYISQSIHEPTWLQWEFINHMLMHSVDYISTSVLRMQLPVKERAIKFGRELTLLSRMPPLLGSLPFLDDCIIVHPGKHFQSKTFPADWWRAFIKTLTGKKDVILIGRTTGPTQGTVDLGELPNRVIDLREHLTLPSLIWLLTNAHCVVSNDSAPVHIAAGGDARIYFFATLKHGDYLKHWRGGQFGPGMTNMSQDPDGMLMDGGFDFVNSPDIVLDTCPDDRMLAILGDPVKAAARILEAEMMHKREEMTHG